MQNAHNGCPLATEPPGPQAITPDFCWLTRRKTQRSPFLAGGDPPRETPAVSRSTKGLWKGNQAAIGKPGGRGPSRLQLSPERERRRSAGLLKPAHLCPRWGFLRNRGRTAEVPEGSTGPNAEGPKLTKQEVGRHPQRRHRRDASGTWLKTRLTPHAAQRPLAPRETCAALVTAVPPGEEGAGLGEPLSAPAAAGTGTSGRPSLWGRGGRARRAGNGELKPALSH